MADREVQSEEMDRREYRRKRRIRNQIISYAVLAVLLIGVIIGCTFGVKKLMSGINDKKHAEELQKQLEELEQEQAEGTAVEAPAEVSEADEETDYLGEIVDSVISEMTLEDKVAGLFMITPEALTGANPVVQAGETTREKLSEYPVGGLIYFKQNMQSSEQLSQMLQNTQNIRKYPLFLGVDEEGGTVSRVAEAGFAENVGSMSDIGATANPDVSREAGVKIGSYLADFGFNLNFAPVADVAAEGNTIIKERSFGTDTSIVSSMTAAYVEGLQGTGVSACMKHFPGIGDADADTHDGAAVTEKTKDDFTAIDFPVYQAGIEAGVDFVMVSHLTAVNVTGDDMPASLSSSMVNDILRGELGYQGIVITDAMNMKAITDRYTADEAAVLALQAGVDMILMPDDFALAYQGVLDAVNSGVISEDRINESLARICRVKYRDKVEN